MSSKCGIMFWTAVICSLIAVCWSDQCDSPVILNQTSGVVTSPGYPDPYPATNCSWILTLGNSSQDVYFWITNLDLDPGDVLSVYNGSVDQNIIHNFTGFQDFGVVYSLAVNTSLKFSVLNTTSNRAGKSFSLRYNTQECVVSAKHSSTGLISSPYFLNTTSGSPIKCTYNVTKPNGFVDLTFVDMNLVNGSLEVKEGNTSLANYTGGVNSVSVSDVISSSTSLTLNMELLSNYTQNFTIAYTRVDPACSFMQTTDETFILVSPDYPGSYGNQHNCLWIIQSPPNTTMTIGFTEFQLADENDHVTIKDGGSSLADNIVRMTAGSDWDKLFFQTSDNITIIQFRSDQMQKDRGFKLLITPTAYGGRLVDEGNFSVGIPPSSNHNDNYPPLDPDDIVPITYQFQAPAGSQVYLEIGDDLTLLPDSTVQFYDGFSAQDSLVGYFTSNSDRRAVFSNTNQLMMVVTGFFDATGKMTKQFIRGKFTSVENVGTLVNSLDVAGGVSINKQEQLYPWHAVWNIHNHLQQDHIALQLHTLDIGVNSSVSVYGGLSDNSSRIAQLNTSTNTVPLIYIPTDREGAKVVYDTIDKIPNVSLATDGDTSQTVLSATYSLIPDCSGWFNDTSGTVSTPGYPQLYPYNAQCSWYINGTANKLIYITFSTLELSQNHSVIVTARKLTTQNVTVGNVTKLVTNVTSRSIGVFKGNGLPNDIVTATNETQLELNFSSSYKLSSDLSVGRGIQINYRIIECGGNVTAGNTKLASPATNSSYTCVWLITLPNNTATTGSVNILKFSYTNTDPNKTSELVIRDGPSVFSTSFPLSVNASTNATLSRTNQLWVMYTYTAPNKTNNTTAKILTAPTFSLEYTTYECKKSKQCNNSICMHDDWKCNGLDECGDGSDEYGCYGNTTINQGYEGWSIGVAILCTFIVTVAVTLIGQAVYKRYRYPAYNELRDLMTPVPT